MNSDNQEKDTENKEESLISIAKICLGFILVFFTILILSIFLKLSIDLFCFVKS